MSNRLLVIIIALLVDDVEESELVHTLACRDHSEPVTELLLLEELLCAAPVLVCCPINRHACSQRTGTSGSDQRKECV